MVERLRLADVEHIATDELVPLITDSFDNLVTVSIAEATNGYIPQKTRRLLRKAEWRLDWQDALLCACGELQVACERMRYTGDPRLQPTEHRLHRVRNRRHEAGILAKKLRRNDFNNSTERKNGTSSHRTAQGWLRQAFPDEYTALVQQERARRHLDDAPETPAFRDVHEQLAYACSHGLITAPRTAEVEALLAASDLTVRNAAADDAKAQEERSMALRHPLLLGRWENALRELGYMVMGQARAKTPHGLGALPDHFYTLPQPEAMEVLNARRFLAAVQQRRTEYKRCVRQLTLALRERRREAPRAVAFTEAKEEASRLLVEAHPAEYAYIRSVLGPYEVRDGCLPTELVGNGQRARIKQSVLTALAQGTWPQPAPTQPDRP
ncbi:hypothetical protein [Streptomyces palmae]|uniref:Uncharacterized protein n=1 Tax=Streptomyces palmae TaxID=1701085 RepID=A0A4Z0GJC5_9ACTN|nr:hypothetical protein [Streptomyces palmae]TGA95961.1 hypothetical protein E4099_24525 [Streptomyces palmae]